MKFLNNWKENFSVLQLSFFQNERGGDSSPLQTLRRPFADPSLKLRAWLRTSAQGQNDTLFVTLRRSRRVSYFLVILRDSISRSVVLRCKPKKLIPIIEKKRFEILHSAIASFRMTEEGILPLCRPFADPSLKLRASAQGFGLGLQLRGRMTLYLSP